MQPSRSRRFVPKHLLHGAALVLAACWLGGCASHDASERDASTGGATSDAPPAKHPIGTGGGGNGENGENGGSGGGKTTPEETPCDQNPVCKSLNALGVGTDETPRLDANGDPLPDTFNPLGSQRHALNPVSELFVGFRFASESSVFELHDDEDETRTNPLVRTYTDDLTAMLSTVVAADLDGDGAQEIAGLWFDEGELVLRVLSDPDGGDHRRDYPLGEYALEALAMAAGDFDGDGRDDLAVACVLEEESQIVFVHAKDDGYMVDPERTLSFPRENPGAFVSWKLASGNIDYDGRSELLGVRSDVTNFSAGEAVADYFVWDDRESDHVELGSGPIQVRETSIHTALVAGGAIVDVDRDGLGEVVLAGITNGTCCGQVEYALLALDDAQHGLEPVASRVFSHRSNSHDQILFRKSVTVNGMDVDGDLEPEVQVNQHVFANLNEPGPGPDGVEGTDDDEAWPLRYSVYLNLPSSQYAELPDSVITVGDMNGDQRDDMALVALDPTGNPAIQIWGLDGPLELARFGAFESLPIEWHSTEWRFGPPVLVAANVDHDTAVVEFSPVETKLVFSEPVVIAALAAPPCAEGIGQNVEACTTSYGHARSQAVEAERSVTFSAGPVVGCNFEERTISQSAFELEFTVQVAHSRKFTKTWTTEKSLSYTTGSLEDAVVFTSIPYDTYTYRFVSHPDPSLVGEEIIVSLPRDPVTLMVERSFYNENAVEGAPRIDDEVFRHAVGRPESYLTSAEKDAIVADFGGKETEPVSVDQGSGEKELGIEVGTEFSAGFSLSYSYELSVKTTVAGATLGLSIGREAENSLSITGGETTSYSGSVGAIDADHFGKHRYSYGLFTYVHELPDGRAFDVVNYWVE